MYDFDIEKVRASMVKAVQLAVAGKKIVSKGTDCWDFLCELEREFRDAAGELQRVEKSMEGDRRRPLLGR